MRKCHYNIPILFCPFPHCGFEQTAADPAHLDNDRFRCKSCEEPFPSRRGEEGTALDGRSGESEWPPATLAEIAGGRVAPLRVALNIPGAIFSV